MASANVKVDSIPYPEHGVADLEELREKRRAEVASPIGYPVRRGLACLILVRGFPLTVGHNDRLRYVDLGDREAKISLSYDSSDNGLIQMPPSLRVFVEAHL
jgi:hypothetical protein